MTNKNILTIEQVKQFERVSSKVSDKYVPIYTSKFIESLDEGFTLVSGSKYRRSSNAHYVIMNAKTNSNVKLYIENSYDRQLSLRLSFAYQNLVFGFIKQIHMGKFANDISLNYQSVSDLHIQASKFIKTLSLYQIDEEDREKLIEELFKIRNIPFYKVINKSVFNFLENENALEYFDRVVGMIMNGEFLVTSKRGKSISSIQARASKNKFLKIRLNKKIYDYLTKNNPELAI